MKFYWSGLKHNKVVWLLLYRVLAMGLGVLLIPVYVKMLGLEQYGMIAFYTTLYNSLTILSFGISTAIMRSVAQATLAGNPPKILLDTVYSAELVNWIVAVLAGVIILAFAQPIGTSWLNSVALEPSTITKAVMVMGLMIVVQFPASVYEGTLMGIHQQVAFSLLSIGFVLLRTVGVIVAMTWLGADLQTFFLYTLIVYTLHILALRSMTYAFINKEKLKRTFSQGILKSMSKYAIGVSATALVTFFITQLDKLIVSKMLSLQYVGFYNLCFSVAGLMSLATAPLNSIVLPKFNLLNTQDKGGDYNHLFFKVSLWVATVVLPLGSFITFFAHDILLLWSGNKQLADASAPILQWVLPGSTLNAIASVVYVYLLGKGNTRFGLIQNIIGAVMLFPFLYYLTVRYGAAGAASCWFIYNAGLFIFSFPVFYHHYIHGKLGYWWARIFLPVAVVAVSWAGLLYYISTQFFNPLTVIVLIGIFVLYLIGIIIILPHVRKEWIYRIRQLRTPG